jgi:AcrR family transcriptional regulator
MSCFIFFKNYPLFEENCHRRRDESPYTGRKGYSFWSSIPATLKNADDRKDSEPMESKATDGQGKSSGDGSSSVVYLTGLRPRPVRDRLLDAMLLAAADVGYEHVAVRHVVGRAGAGRQSFYTYFENKDDCFAQAHEAALERLYERVIGAAKQQPSWREGLRAGLADLLGFCADEPLVARALFIEVHAAGGKALANRNEVMERFARAIDSARNESSSQSPPPVTAAFMVGAIETMVATRLTSGETDRIRDLLPGILHFVVLPYFGEDAAWEELASAPLASWDSARRESDAARPALIPAAPGTARRS